LEAEVDAYLAELAMSGTSRVDGWWCVNHAGGGQYLSRLGVPRCGAGATGQRQA